MTVADPLINQPIRSFAVLGKTKPISARVATTQDADVDEMRLREIIRLGKKALDRKRCTEHAFDLLGLDGVSLPLAAIRQEPQ